MKTAELENQTPTQTYAGSMFILRNLFHRAYGIECTTITRLPQAGGDRVYLRLSDNDTGKSAIGVIGPDLRENRTFLDLSICLNDIGMPVPRVLEVADNVDVYLLEDLGDISLFDLIKAKKGADIEEKCMRILAKLQTIPKNKWEHAVQFPRFGARQASWDLHYFKYEFLKPSGIVFDEENLEKDFDAIRDAIENWPDVLSGFMYRDFQSRNIMVKDGIPRLIDYQGGREGPALYDAISFLWQAKADFSSDRKNALLRIYAEEFAKLRGISPELILKHVPFIALLRTLQVLGAYGFRGLIEHRAHFIESIPMALENLSDIISSGIADRIPELKRVCIRLASDPRFKKDSTCSGLTVHVFSFSYKKGYPDDFTGNGGGFMFDCRAIHNPGRYPEYRQLTGRDRPVIDFLEQRGEVFTFLKGAWMLTDATVEKYIKRGFSSLQIGYGCTGGQHRSVYCAEATAKHISQKFPEAKVILIHREQDIKEIFN